MNIGPSHERKFETIAYNTYVECGEMQKWGNVHTCCMRGNAGMGKPTHMLNALKYRYGKSYKHVVYRNEETYTNVVCWEMQEWGNVKTCCM